MNTTETASPVRRAVAALRRAATAPARIQTYKNLLYLALAFPLGLLYFVGFITGTTLGIGLIITWVGLPILGATLAGATLVVGLEARLATLLVGIDASAPAFIREFEARDGIALPGNGFLATVTRLVTAPSTWTSVVLVLTKSVFGLVSFISLVTAGAIGATLIAAPLLYQDPGWVVGRLSELSAAQYTVGPWVVDTLPEALGVSAGGVVFLVAALNAMNALARIQASYTATLLRIDYDPT